MKPYYDSLEDYNADVEAARTEYRRHPIADVPCGAHCAAEGCPEGLRRQREKADKIRDYRRARRAAGLKS